MAFSGSQTTALQVYGIPGKVKSFSAKTAAGKAKPLGGLLTLGVGT